MKNSGLILLLAFVIFGSCNNATSPDEIGDRFAFINFTLIDGTGSAPVSDAALVVENGRITAVGSVGSTPIPASLPIIDLSGAYVLPGFFNAHIHSGFNRTNLEAWARGGVTTVRDLCGPTLFVWRDSVRENPACARLVAAGPMISVPNGYPYVPWGASCMLPVYSVDDARQKTAQLLAEGADIIKISMESGESFGMEIPSLSHDEASAIVEVAHEHGTLVSAHVLVSYDLGRALEAGADDMAHMITDFLPDSTVDQMITDTIYWVPTLELWQKVGYGTVDAAIINLRKFVQAGGEVALGTDYDGYDAVFQIGMPLDEMNLMRRSGMSEMDIIVAGTKNAARVCNLEDEIGTLEIGKIADILVVNSNPLEDINNLADILMVIHDGVVIRDER
ncbi:MAG: amidohydrolase family protein [Candidatus Zixiibacteriota bacterium]